jgi:ATP-dependent DNA helicase RecQ
MDQIAETLDTRFGFSEFREGQETIVRLLVEGSSAASVFPTGAGKSLCYQLPALLLPGITLVISPLIALMKDQIDQLRQRGIDAARLDSSLSLDDYRAAMHGIRTGRIKLVYVSPERFNNERFRETLRGLRISLMAVDEAHCISEWGHNFRPDYLKLPRYAEMFGVERILALTATATPAVLDDICEGFRIDPKCSVRTEFYRPNLHLHTSEIGVRDRDRTLIERLGQARGPVIVYVTLVRTAESLARTLVEAGIEAQPYHAQLKPDQRHRIQEWFTASDSAVVVATIAFGMGIDKSNIRGVIHYNLPKSLENYAQEIGRSGRDGETARCEMFVCGEDLSVLENFIYGDTPGEDSVRSFVRDIFSRGETFELTGRELSIAHDIRPLVVQTLLTYLELDGYFEVGTPIYSVFQFEPHVASREILEQTDDQERDFVKNVLLRARKARKWFRIDVDATAGQLGCTRDRIGRCSTGSKLSTGGEPRARSCRWPGSRVRRGPRGVVRRAAQQEPPCNLCRGSGIPSQPWKRARCHRPGSTAPFAQ